MKYFSDFYISCWRRIVAEPARPISTLSGQEDFQLGSVMRLLKRELKSYGTAERRKAETAVESVALRMKLAGSNSSSRVSGVGKLNSSSGYFIGNDPAA
jgi:hypothetical protein